MYGKGARLKIAENCNEKWKDMTKEKEYCMFNILFNFFLGCENQNAAG
ncbi:hypothetical protein FACS189472_15270 [Alphaproteobacteria bacterium]|nr:hypothetical protein FACS189472_15270 [Alphaproteobacteria bacterium]